MVGEGAEKYIQGSSCYASVQLQIVLCTERVTKDVEGVAREIWCQMKFALFEWRKTLFYDSMCSKAHEVNMPVN